MNIINKYYSKIFSTKDKKVLVENFFSLSALQVASYFFPLLTLPYLVRVLSPEKFGLIAFASGVLQYFSILTDYGFNLSATREISINRNNSQKIAEIFNAVMFIKTVLTVISFIVLCVIIFSFSKFHNDWIIYILSFGIVIGNVLFPVWFFQGIERMRYITVLNIIGKLIFTIAIFVFVRKQNDYFYVPLITSLGSIITGFVGLWLSIFSFKIKLRIPSIPSLKHQVINGWHIFISTSAVSLYTNSNIVILGFFANNTIVAYYSAAEKLALLIHRLLGPISQSIYPYISKLAHESKIQTLFFLRKILILFGGISLIFSTILFIFAPQIIHIVFGLKYMDSIPVLRILAFLPFLIALSNVFGSQTMLPFNMKEAFSRIYVSAGIINIILAFLLTPTFKQIGISTSVLITETFVTLAMFIYLSKKGFLDFKFLISAKLTPRYQR